MRSAHVVVSSVIYGGLAWAVFVLVAVALFGVGGAALPWCVGLCLAFAGGCLAREGHAEGGWHRLAGWAGFMALLWAALYVVGVL